MNHLVYWDKLLERQVLFTGVQNWVQVLTKRAPTMFLPRLCQANTAPIVGEMRHSSCQTSRKEIEFILQRTSNTLYSSSFVNVKYSYTMNRSISSIGSFLSSKVRYILVSCEGQGRQKKTMRWGKIIPPSCHQAAAPNLVCFLFIHSCCWPCFWCAAREETSRAEHTWNISMASLRAGKGLGGGEPGQVCSTSCKNRTRFRATCISVRVGLDNPLECIFWGGMWRCWAGEIWLGRTFWAGEVKLPAIGVHLGAKTEHLAAWIRLKEKHI